MKTSIHRARQFLLRKQNDRRLSALARQLQARVSPDPNQRPVIFFNASTRLGGISQNAAFAALAAMGLQLAGVPVHYFACRAGMSRCPLGVVINGPGNPPPCRTCVAQSQVLFGHAPIQWFEYAEDAGLATTLEGKNVEQLAECTYNGIPLGALTLPSMRWVLRLHHLRDDDETCTLFRSFILAAYRVIQEFDSLLNKIDPQCVVVFNGVSYPEAGARWAALQRGVPVITHEVAHRPLTAFFSDEQVTAYPVHIPENFELNAAQNARLDAALRQRFQGDFSMAGLEFWPEMKGLDEGLLAKIDRHKQLVPVFSNVIFDTSQIHANVIFEHMFAWLDQILEIIRAHPDTLFVIRAHPDELRPHSRKQSRETVDEWAARTGAAALPNVVYVSPREYLSSYALIQQAKFVMAYNSTIGLEAALMGKVVLNGGRARYTPHNCVYLPSSPEAHRKLAEDFLSAESLSPPAEFTRNARRFQYYQLFRTPLAFGSFLDSHPTRGYVNLKDFPVEALEQSEAIQVILHGILEGEPFLMPEVETNKQG